MKNFPRNWLMNKKESKEKLTILTDPLESQFDYYTEKIKALLRPLLRKLDGKKPLGERQYGGHHAVTRSLVEGLKQAGIPFVYNPGTIDQCTGKVVVLAGLSTLRQALELKRSGKIRWLAAGPNLVIMPSDCPEVIGSKLIDKLIVNSQWIKDAYCRQMPQLLKSTVIWPAGADTDYWNPRMEVKKSNLLLFYYKNTDRKTSDLCKTIAEQKGFMVNEIRYGAYTPLQFKQQLNKSKLLIYFGQQESQGIALLESWAMNVPTLVWNGAACLFSERRTAETSAAPYLSPETGMFFSHPAEFEKCLDRVRTDPDIFRAREWVLQNMTDRLSALNLIEQLGRHFEN